MILKLKYFDNIRVKKDNLEKKMTELKLVSRAINTIRFLSADAVQEANSGHPGLPMGDAAMAYVVWKRHLKFDPQTPFWVDRDRFILSPGHGSMLLYSLLHLAGYDLSLDDLKNFRQWGSKTPGHPEYGHTPGVETTTGPLGQGLATGVGMAIAAEHLAAVYNRPNFPVVDHWFYGIVSDGDLMEGVASEAASLAGHLKLGRLIYLYDDNQISIDGSTDLAFTEDRAKRFEAYGWHIQHVDDGNDIEAVDQAITAAKADPRPSLILCKTRIGFGLPTREGTSAAHGQPPGEEELAGAKEKLGWPQSPRFLVEDDVRAHYAEQAAAGKAEHTRWDAMFEAYRREFPALAAQFERTQAGTLPEDWREALPVFEADKKGIASRIASGQVLNAIAATLPELMGGSADLTGSNKTDIKGEEAFSEAFRAGRYIYYGVREHAMGAIMNGISVHGGLIPYGGTFLVFADYMRPTIRLAALMGLRAVYVFTHDSIGLGEDGPTHQPIEHLASLRIIPNSTVIRPGDANETAYAWQAALENRTGPTALALTRQALPTLDRSQFAAAEGLLKGAYVLADLGDGPLDLILMASGSEVGTIVEAGQILAGEGHNVRLVSFPSWELFKAQGAAYRETVLPRRVKARLAIEAGTTIGWDRWVGDEGQIIGIDRFGASAPFQEIYQNLGLTVENVLSTARAMIKETAVKEMGA